MSTNNTPTRTVRNISGAALTLAAACLVQMLTGGAALARTTAADCAALELRTIGLCRADSCGGVCTLTADNRCHRMGANAYMACLNYIATNASPRPPRPPKPDFGPTQVSQPDLSNPGGGKPRAPQQGMPRPLSNPTPTMKPKGPQQATPRPMSNPSSGGPVLRTGSRR